MGSGVCIGRLTGRKLAGPEKLVAADTDRNIARWWYAAAAAAGGGCDRADIPLHGGCAGNVEGATAKAVSP